jgi:glycosyltransferase involved in cell wall biosynthesis
MSVHGGAETVVTKLASYLTKRGIENLIVTISVSQYTLEACKGLNLVAPTGKYSYKMRSQSFRDALGIINEIMVLRYYVKKIGNSFDVVNVHNFPATWSLFPKRKPCVWMCNELPELWHNLSPSPYLKMVRNLGVEFDKVVVNSSISAICVADEVSAERVFERYGRSSKIVHYGIDYDLFADGDRKWAAEKYGLHDSFVLLHVGWINLQKNQLESIKALEQLRKEIPNIKLVLAGGVLPGDAPYEKMLRSYIHARGLEDHVVFTGFLSRHVIKHLYHACDVALFPIKSQGGWLSPFEALCAGKPIVVSSSMTAAVLVKKEGLGVVTDDFAEAVGNIYNNMSFYKKIAEKGRRFVAEKLGWDAFCEKMLAVFENVLYEWS